MLYSDYRGGTPASRMNRREETELGFIPGRAAGSLGQTPLIIRRLVT